MHILYNHINLLINIFIIIIIFTIIIKISLTNFFELKKLFNHLYKIKMLKEFIILILLIYLTLITIFAVIYYLIAFSESSSSNFLTWLYFSSITIAAVGYGDITPINTTMQIIATVESLISYLSLPIIVSIGLSIIFKN